MVGITVELCCVYKYWTLRRRTVVGFAPRSSRKSLRLTEEAFFHVTLAVREDIRVSAFCV